mmetsp:Transcript_90809/g.283959  ORF Transcript_90809/g.283959 Transcript_90809/m.283959 type:complete len:146 (+) Transcript_90809:100-537(+)
MAPRALLLLACLLGPELAAAGLFGPPKFVQDACKRWCAVGSADADAFEACSRCNEGPQTNPACSGGADCDYCQREIAFPRRWPKLWREEPTFEGKMAKLEGKTRCWCDTGCPVYYIKSWLFCGKECAAICHRVPADVANATVISV